MPLFSYLFSSVIRSCVVLSMPVECVLTSICGTFCVIVVCMTDVRVDV